MNLRNFFAELKRRNVYKVAVAYVVVAWLIIQVATQVFPFFEIPNWAIRLVVLLLILGFPVALILAWAFELTPEGIKLESEIAPNESITRRTGRKIVGLTIAVGVIATGLLVFRFLGPKFTPVTAPATIPAAAAPTAIPAKSIAVLPFENLSSDKSNAYFSDGITEEILNALAQIPGLKVAARRSAFQFKGNDLDLRKIGQLLGVAHILEGSLQKAGDQVRINVQLVDAQDGLQVWSEKYDRKLDNVFAVEDEIATAIATKLRVQLTGGGGQPLVANGTSNSQAHELYLRGLSLLAARGPGLSEAAAAFHEAVELDPDYAQAWGSLAITEMLLPSYGLGNIDSALSRGESAAEKALSLDPNTASAYVALGMGETTRCQWPKADAAFRRALTLAPGNAEAVNQYAQFLGTVGQNERCLSEIERAQQLDPLSPIIGVVRAGTLMALRRYDEAADQLKATLAAHPRFGPAHTLETILFIERKLYPEAEANLRSFFELNGLDPGPRVLLLRGMANPEQHAAAVQSLDHAPENADLRNDPVPYAFFLMALGERSRALDQLEIYAAKHDSNFGAYLWFGCFDPLRSDPRFKAVLAKLNLPYAPPPTLSHE